MKQRAPEQGPNSAGRRIISGAFLAVGMALAGCTSGGGPSSPGSGSQAEAALLPSGPAAANTPAPAVAAAPVPVELTYTLPATANAASQTPSTAAVPASGLSAQTVPGRKRQYISSSNTLITITVTPIGGTGSTYGPATCSTGSCAINFTALPGPNTLAFTLTDNASTVLSTFSTVQIIAPATRNTLAFTANPVVSSVVVQLTAATMNAGTPQDTVLTVNAKDADSKIITGSGNYMDAAGNPLALVLSTSNIQAGGNGTVTLTGPTRISSPSHQAISAHYNGGWLDHTNISVASTSSAVTTLTGATLTTVPQAVEYTVAGSPVGIVTGPDGNLWFTEYNGNTIGTISPGGTNYVTHGCGACSHPIYLTNGPNGNFWITEEGGNHLDTMTPGGANTRLGATPAAACDIVAGPDGNVWYAYDMATGGVGKVTLAGTIQNYTTGHSTRGLIFGPDGNIWYTDITANVIGKESPNGTVLATYGVANFTGGGGSWSDQLAVGPDGDVWFPNYGSNLIEKTTMSGAITPYSVQAGALPRSIVAGRDGYMWFTESGKDAIGRISTSGALQEFGTAYGIHAGAGPIGITVGPDGNIWFAEFGGNRIGKFVL